MRKVFSFPVKCTRCFVLRITGLGARTPAVANAALPAHLDVNEKLVTCLLGHFC